MCGIFGIINYDGDHRRYMSDIGHIKEMTANLLSVSQARGTDASGICVVTMDNEATVYKARTPGRSLPTDPIYANIMRSVSYQSNFRYMFGHVRSKTKGTKYKNVNNHPIVAGRVVGVHNGVISNDDSLFSVDSTLTRKGEVDSEIIFRLLDKYISNGAAISIAVKNTTKELVGSYSCAFMHLDRPSYLTLFAGHAANIAVQDFSNRSLMVFASTDDIIKEAAEKLTLFNAPSSKFRIRGNTGIRINITNGKIYTFNTVEICDGNVNCTSAQSYPHG